MTSDPKGSVDLRRNPSGNRDGGGSAGGIPARLGTRGRVIPLLPCATFAIWIVCVIAGVVGLRIGYPSPAAPTPEVQTQLLTAELPKDATPPAPPQPEPAPEPKPVVADISSPAPAEPPPAAVPQAPAITPVAAPSAAIAFAVPVEGLTRIVEVSQAAHAVPAGGGPSGTGGGAGAPPPPPPSPPAPRPVAPVPPPVVPLTWGVGEGRQPQPEYPRDALLARQEGTVNLRFQVDETGRVTTVEITKACRWPLLNQAAVRAVRDTWHFTPGPARTFEVPIQFQIARNTP